LRNNTLIQHLDLSSNLIEELPNLPGLFCIHMQ
jgi:hypothetical protein